MNLQYFKGKGLALPLYAWQRLILNKVIKYKFHGADNKFYFLLIQLHLHLNINVCYNNKYITGSYAKI